MSAECPELTVLPPEAPPDGDGDQDGNGDQPSNGDGGDGGDGNGNGDQEPPTDRLGPLAKTLLGSAVGGAVGLGTAFVNK